MFKTSHLGVLKFGFLSLCPFGTENPNEMLILSLKTISFSEHCSFRVMSKIDIAKKFMYGKDKIRKNQSLIHINKRF